MDCIKFGKSSQTRHKGSAGLLLISEFRYVVTFRNQSASNATG